MTVWAQCLIVMTKVIAQVTGYWVLDTKDKTTGQGAIIIVLTSNLFQPSDKTIYWWPVTLRPTIHCSIWHLL